MSGSANANAYGGVIDELVAGRWIDPNTGAPAHIPIENIVIEANLDGHEAELVKACHPEGSLTIVHDEITREVLGARVLDTLRASGRQVDEYVWARPRCTDEGVEELRAETRGTDALIAVGSGTVSDSVKYATFLDGRPYSVFPTSPMNAYTTPTASVSFDGFKRSVPCHSANGVFFDLAVLAKCPSRLVAAAFADVVCRTTAQVDWLLSHLLFATPYVNTPYILLAYDEDDMIANADKLAAGDIHALGMLTRVAAIMGLGTGFTGTTHCGSMAEHMISHYIDMFAGAAHPGTSHGEQVGVATLTMSRLQNAVLNADGPPTLQPTSIPEEDLRRRHGDDTAEMMIKHATAKALDSRQADALNAHLEQQWPEITRRLSAAARPCEELHAAMRAAGCPLTWRDLGLPEGFYDDAVRYARFIRDRYTMLDVSGDAGTLEAFVSACE